MIKRITINAENYRNFVFQSPIDKEYYYIEGIYDDCFDEQPNAYEVFSIKTDTPLEDIGEICHLHHAIFLLKVKGYIPINIENIIFEVTEDEAD